MWVCSSDPLSIHDWPGRFFRGPCRSKFGVILMNAQADPSTQTYHDHMMLQIPNTSEEAEKYLEVLNEREALPTSHRDQYSWCDLSTKCSEN